MTISHSTSNSPSHLHRAVILAAGRGTKLYPITRAIPKEMLPIGRKPLLEYIVEELRAADLTELIFVISPWKNMIREYFGDGSAWGVSCKYVVQSEVLGPADAILRVEELVQGEPFVLAFGDNIYECGSAILQNNPSSALMRLIQSFIRNRAHIALLTEFIPQGKVDANHTVLVPITTLSCHQYEPFPLRFSDLSQEQLPGQMVSTVVAAARWILTSSIFDYLRQAKSRVDGESYLIDVVPNFLADGGVIWAVPLHSGEIRNNLDVWEAYLSMATRLAVSDPELGLRVRANLGLGMV